MSHTLLPHAGHLEASILLLFDNALQIIVFVLDQSI